MHIEETTTLLEATRPPSACVIDFFEARDRLKPGLEEHGQQLEIKGKSQKLALHRLPTIKRADRLEESVYWVLSAVTVVYLLLGIIGR
jgi:hypothetical protein